MMKKYFLDLFEYNNWANDKIILKLQDLNIDFIHRDPAKILGHIISSQDAWLERIKGTKKYNIFLWDEYSIQELSVLSLNSHKEWLKFINKLKDDQFSKICEYKISRGKKIEKTYQDILQNVVNHSTYHRGQINLIFTMNNIKPVKIDFTDYC